MLISYSLEMFETTSNQTFSNITLNNTNSDETALSKGIKVFLTVSFLIVFACAFFGKFD